MATATKDTLQETTSPQASPSMGFGAYAGSPTADLGKALDRPPISKLNGSVDFADSDKRWLKDFGISTTDPNSFHHAWMTDLEKYNSEHRKWTESYGGRLAIRAVSRGVVGAAFYAAAQMYAGNKMEGYTRDSDPQNMLQRIARIIDKTVGQGIQWTTKHVARGTEEQSVAKALKAVTFRDTVDYGYKQAGKSVLGRSLGHEAMNVTFDFASMSFGDYMTRYVLGLMDPNAHTKWIKDGHVDVPGGLKDLFKNVFRGVTYAAGEDMAVAIPYVYGMRLQRNVINKFSPGFKYDVDRSLNGGSYKVDGTGKIIGDFQQEGALDLMGRFSWYNVGTKMFRDAYNGVAERAEKWWEGDRSLKLPTLDPKKFTVGSVLSGAAQGVRYVARTTTKVMGYMLPATIAFWGTRTPQSKVRGIAIHSPGAGEGPESKGMMVREVHGFDSKNPRIGSNLDQGVEEKYRRVKLGTGFSNDMKNEKVYFMKNMNDYSAASLSGPLPNYPFGDKYSDAFNDKFYTKNGVKPPLHDPFSRAAGKFSYNTGSAYYNVISSAADKFNAIIKPIFGTEVRWDRAKTEKFSRIYANAAISYTPYFMLKTDVLSAEWDTSRTDMALDRSFDGLGKFISGAVTFNGKKMQQGMGEIRAGVNESMRALMREPFRDPNRELQAQLRRWGKDPEHLSNEAFQQYNARGHQGVLTQAHAAGAQKVYATEDLRARNIAPATFTHLKPKDTNWVAQEAVRKFQQETPAPGQAVH